MKYKQYTSYKNSDVNWLGEIPSHWEIVQSRRLFKDRKERARSDDEQLTASQKHGVIYQKEYIELEGRQVTQVLTGTEILKHVESGDFVISMSRKVEDKIANTGRFHVIKNRFGIDGVTYPSTINTNIGVVLIHEGSSQSGMSTQNQMNNSQEFLRKELANKYKDMEKKVEGFE